MCEPAFSPSSSRPRSRTWAGRALLGGLGWVVGLAAQAAGIGYQATLIDAASQRWRYTYDLTQYAVYGSTSFLAGDVLDFDFNANLYADLTLLPEGPGVDWSAMVIQPDPALPALGYYDLQAQVRNPSLAGPFTVAFTWLGSGTPGWQSFEVYDSNFRMITGSITHPVPEPASAYMLMAGLLGGAWMLGGRRGRVVRRARGSAALLAGLGIALASSADVSVVRYDLVGTQRASRTLFDYTYQVTFTNTGGAIKNTVGTVSSNSTSTVVVDGTSVIGALSAGETTQSYDTITIRQDRLKPFTPGSLQWQFSSDMNNHAPVARASADALSTSVGQVVLFDGTASTDADFDPLSFAWGVLNAPQGSTTVLERAQGSRAALRIDRAGNYQVQLTVNDGKVASPPVTLSIFAAFPSHSPAWLSRPAGPGSEAGSAAYYANQPFVSGCWDINFGYSPPRWQCPERGAESFSDAWPTFAGWNPSQGGGTVAAFYSPNSLAVGRRATCREADPSWPNGAGVSCIVSNHGPIPGTAGFPNPDAALADAVANRSAVSASAMVATVGRKVNTTVTISEKLGCLDQSFAFAVHAGDVVSVGPGSGSIWAGDAFFASNGPDGVAGYQCVDVVFPDSKSCPMNHGPLFGLVLKPLSVLNADGTASDYAAKVVGSQSSRYTIARNSGLNLCINDLVPGNGSGQFTSPLAIEPTNTVSFQVYDGYPYGRLTDKARLDREGAKQVPNACISCHGGQLDPRTQTVSGASFLPFVVADLQFSSKPGSTRADQERALRELNRLVLKTRPNADDPNDPIAVWIKGTYANFTRTTADDSFVPPGWSGDALLYRQVARPYCMSCHQAQRGNLSFGSAAQFRAMSASIRGQVCGSRGMPHAEASLVAFRQSDALQVLQRELFGGAGCSN